MGGENVGIPGLWWFCVTAPWGWLAVVGGRGLVGVLWFGLLVGGLLWLVVVWCLGMGDGGVGGVVCVCRLVVVWFLPCLRHAGGAPCFQGFAVCFVVWVCVLVWGGVSFSSVAAQRCWSGPGVFRGWPGAVVVWCFENSRVSLYDFSYVFLIASPSPAWLPCLGWSGRLVGLMGGGVFVIVLSL